jgi:hypothetical protein
LFVVSVKLESAAIHKPVQADYGALVSCMLASSESFKKPPVPAIKPAKYCSKLEAALLL